MVELKESFVTLWHGKSPFGEIKTLQGEAFRELRIHCALRFEVMDKSYFLKWHCGTTLKEIVKNLLSLQMPVLGADREWNTIHRLQDVGVDTMCGVAFDKKSVNPLTRTSLIITEDLTPTISLEDYCAGWTINLPGVRVKHMFIEYVATMMCGMHVADINHRDYYICHFLLHLPFSGREKALKISVIDPRRAQIRAEVPRCWWGKDLIGLYFLSMSIGLTQRDIWWFTKMYSVAPFKGIIKQEQGLLPQVEEKATKVRERMTRKSL